MVDIDYIMSLIDWNKSISEQAEGIRLAEDVENFNVFLQPCNKNYSKNVWDNCAKILSMRTDDELSPYLVQMMEWLRDLNWPGAFCIIDRLQRYGDGPSYDRAFDTCIKYARALGDDVWENNLRTLKRKSR